MYGIKLILICALVSLKASAQISNDINLSNTDFAGKAKQLTQLISFNYYAKYLGPSLSGSMPQGSTYNRFSTGQDWKDDKGDHTNSHQIFHALSVGIKLPRYMALQYQMSFQDNLNDNIPYQSKNFDGTYSTYTREKGRSQNNDRISLWVPNIHSNNHFFISSSFFYEMPSSEGSQESQLQYGVGIQPTLGFYSPISWLYYGVSASLERYQYPDNQFVPVWCRVDCHKNSNQVRRQKAIYSLSPYMGVIINDKLSLRSSLVFDWDQYGDSNRLRENLDDIFSLGLNYSLHSKLSVGAGIEGSLETPSPGKSALFANLLISI